MITARLSQPVRVVLFVLGSSLFPILAGAAFAVPPACKSITDGLVRVPGNPDNYATFVPPLKGRTYVDPEFGCVIMRLTDTGVEYPTEGVHMGHDYSSRSPFNSDSTRVLVAKSSGFYQVRDLIGTVIRSDLNTFGILTEGNPVWSRTDPNLLYFTTRKSPCGSNPYCRQVLLKSFNVSTSALTTLKDFSSAQNSNFDRVQIGWGEGDISWDGTRLPMIACKGGEWCLPSSPTGAWVFIHNLVNGTHTSPVNVTGQGANNNDILPSTNRMVVQRVLPGQQGAIDLYNANGQLVSSAVLDYIAHWDRGKDTDGTDMFVIGNGGDASQIPGCLPPGSSGPSTIRFRLPASPPFGGEQCLMTKDWALADHVSCNNVGQDWCLVDTYSCSVLGDPLHCDTPVDLSFWPTYANEILMRKMDGSPTIRLAHSRSSGFAYEKQPRAAVSQNGKYILFDSDMRDNCDSDPTCTAKADVYMLCTDNPTVTVTYPNGGGTLWKNSTVNLTWSAVNFCGGVDKVDILLSRNGPGGTFENIAVGIANSGSYPWTVTGPTTSNAYLKIVGHDRGDNTWQDLSNSAFVIATCGPCQVSYCAGEGSRCTWNNTCGGGGCCSYSCSPDLSCTLPDPCPPNACGCN